MILRADYIEIGPDGTPMPCRLTYRVVLPFAVDFETVAIDDPHHHMWSCDIPTPISAQL